MTAVRRLALAAAATYALARAVDRLVDPYRFHTTEEQPWTPTT